MTIFPALGEPLLSIVYLGTLLLLAKFGEEAFRKLGLVPFVGAILAGILIGPGALNLIQVVPSISLFISLGINFLLFVSGAEEFESERVRSMLNDRGMILSAAEFCLRFSGITIVAFLLFHQLIPAVIIGVVAGMASAGPLTRLLVDTGLSRTDEGASIFSQVLVIEIAAVVLFSFVYDLAGTVISLSSIAVIAVELSVAIVAVILFGRYIMIPILEGVERRFSSREAVFAVIISTVLLTGFIGQLTGFNSALVALFLGFLLQRFFAGRPVLMEKLHAFTYGFFEPLFFIGLGLYFVPVTPYLLVAGVAIFGAAILLDSGVGAAVSRFFGVSAWRNAFGTCVNGGVDATLLVTALTAGTALIGGYTYSATAIGIALLSLTAPLLFRIRAPIVAVDQQEGTKKIVKQQLDTLTSYEISKSLPTVSIREDELVKSALKRCLDLDSRAIVVVNSQNKPIGSLLMRNAIALTQREMQTIRASGALLAEAVTVGEGEPALELAGIFRTKNIPIISVVDKEGKLVGTIMEREILRRIVTSLE